MHLLAAYELCLLILVVTLLPVATPMPPVGAALRNVGRLPYIHIRFGFLLLVFISGKFLQALAVAGKEATSEVHLLAAYVVWLLMLVLTLKPVVIPRQPLVGRVALRIPPVVVRARAALRNVGRLPYIHIRFGFLLLLFISGKFLQALAVAGKEATSEVHLLAAYVVWLLILVLTLMPVVIPRPPLVGRVALLIPLVVVRARATLRNVGRLPDIPIRFCFLLLLFISGKLLQALAVAGKEATSEVHLLAAYVVWLLMLVLTLMPVVIPRPPLVGRVALLIPPVVVRARATLRNVGRLPYIPTYRSVSSSWCSSPASSIGPYENDMLTSP